MPYGLGELKPFAPFSSLIGGFGAGQQMQTDTLKREAMRTGLEREREMTGALQEYKQSGDPTVFRGVNPELAIRLQDHLDKQTPEALKGYEKAASFIQKSRGVITPGNWSAYKTAIEKQGWLPSGTLPEQVNPQSLKELLYMPEMIQAHMKTLPQRLAVESRERVARESAASRERVANIGAASREAAAGTTAGARIKAAEIGAAAKGQSGRQITPFKQFILDPEIAKLPPAEQVREFNRSLTGARQTELQTEKAKQAKTTTRLLERLEQKSGGKPAGASTSTGYQGPAYYYDKGGKEVAVHSQAEYDKLVGK